MGEAASGLEFDPFGFCALGGLDHAEDRRLLSEGPEREGLRWKRGEERGGLTARLSDAQRPSLWTQRRRRREVSHLQRGVGSGRKGVVFLLDVALDRAPMLDRDCVRLGREGVCV